MIGDAQISIQPSEAALAVPANPYVGGQWYRGIPTPGIAGLVPAVGGVATCRNLIANSPPTLLELYEIYSLTIGWAVLVGDASGFASVPNLSVEMALLVNDQVRYTNVVQAVNVASSSGTTAQYATSGAWVADIVNPIRVGARERLGLRVGVLSDIGGENIWVRVGTQMDPTFGAVVPYDSEISYRVIDLPGSRRL